MLILLLIIYLKLLNANSLIKSNNYLSISRHESTDQINFPLKFCQNTINCDSLGGVKWQSTTTINNENCVCKCLENKPTFLQTYNQCVDQLG